MIDVFWFISIHVSGPTIDLAERLALCIIGPCPGAHARVIYVEMMCYYDIIYYDDVMYTLML